MFLNVGLPPQGWFRNQLTPPNKYVLLTQLESKAVTRHSFAKSLAPLTETLSPMFIIFK